MTDLALQNRVDPLGKIVADTARGIFTGNRGIIHDPTTRSLLRRRWTTKAWIICTCAWRGRRRDVMGFNGPRGSAGWTELFFLDEVTALAAGHRPCFTCRREAARQFAHAWAQAEALERVSAPHMDSVLHGQRMASGGSAVVLDLDRLSALPDGAMVASGDDTFAIRNGGALPWSFAGYGAPLPIEALAQPVRSITPFGTIATLQHGFQPVWHPTAA